MVIININEIAKVKLTDYGKKVLRIKNYPEPEEDEEGYVKFQIHALIEVFGGKTMIDSTKPFETNIKIDQYEVVE